MADTSTLLSVEGNATWDYQDSVTEVYQVVYDSVPADYFDALTKAQAATGAPVPARRKKYAASTATDIYATSIRGERASDASRRYWNWTVIYSVPPDLDTIHFDNPLLRPIVYNVDYIEREIVEAMPAAG